MGLTRPFPDSFWLDRIVNEEYTSDDKLVYVYLVTNSHMQQLGIYKITKKLMSFELGMNKERVETALKNLEERFNVIKYSEKTQEVAILDYYKYGILKGGKPLESCFEKLEKKVEDFSLLKELYDSSRNISDSREVFSIIMHKIKAQLQSMDLLNDSEESSDETTINDINNKNYINRDDLPF